MLRHFTWTYRYTQSLFIQTDDNLLELKKPLNDFLIAIKSWFTCYRNMYSRLINTQWCNSVVKSHQMILMRLAMWTCGNNSFRSFMSVVKRGHLRSGMTHLSRTSFTANAVNSCTHGFLEHRMFQFESLAMWNSAANGEDWTSPCNQYQLLSTHPFWWNPPTTALMKGGDF